MATFDGTDVSNHQGPVMVTAWDQVVDLGGTGGWWKVTQGKSYLDPYATQHRQATERAGLRYRGPYHWLSHTSAVHEQFAWFERWVGDLHEGEAIQLDVEEDGLTLSQVKDAIDLWEERYPGRVLHYMGRYFAGSMVDLLIARYGHDFRWWLPWYGRSTLPTGLPATPVVWQWAGGTGGVMLDGVGRVDSNQIIDRARLELVSGYRIKEPAREPASIPEPVVLEPAAPSSVPIMPTPTADLTGGTGVLTRISVSGALAVFYGDMDAQGVVHIVRWVGPNMDNRLRGAAVNQLVRSQASMKDFTLIGPVPHGDLMEWSTGNFYAADSE